MAAEPAADLAALKAAAMVGTPPLPHDHLLVAPVAIALLFGAVLLMLRRRAAWQAPVAIAGLSLLLLADLLVLGQVMGRGPVTMMMGGWRPPFGIAFTVDMTGALFLVASGVAALGCGLHAAGAISVPERRHGFFAFLFLTMAGVSGAFLTGDLFNLYVWFEVMLIGSFGLIVLGSQDRQIDGALKYAFLNLVGTTLFLVATGLLYGAFGTLNMADIAVKARAGAGGEATITLAALFLAAFALKAAVFPLNVWLPASYHTPRFVVSALFAGLLTKVGLYAAIRVLAMLLPAERDALSGLLAFAAVATMLVGALGALAQNELRRLLNYLVVAGIGTALAGLAVSRDAPAAQDALSGSIFYALHAIVAMSAAYLAAAHAARVCGAVTLSQMGGLWRKDPLLSALLMILLLAICGLPLSSGFWPKLALIGAAISAGLPWLAGGIVVSSFLLVLCAARIVSLAVWRPKPGFMELSPRDITERDAAGGPAAVADAAGASLAPLVALVALVVAIGLAPQVLMRLTDAAAAGILDPAAYVASVFGGAR